MAVAALRCRTALGENDACVISRFVGVTPASSSGTCLGGYRVSKPYNRSGCVVRTQRIH
jgi:hypothetical protein